MSGVYDIGYNEDGSSYTIYDNTGYGGGSYGGGSSPNFWSALTQGLTASAGILGTRYAVPQLNNGQVIQTGPNGTYMSQNATGAIPNLLGAGGSSSTLLLLGVGAVVLLMMFKGKG